MAIVHVPIRTGTVNEVRTLNLLGMERGQVPAAGQGVVGQASEPRLGTWLVALVSIPGVVLLAFLLNRWFDHPNFASFKPVPIEGVTAFAVFFVAAQALERFLEPLSKIILPKETKEDDKESEEKAVDEKVQQAEDKLRALFSDVSDRENEQQLAQAVNETKDAADRLANAQAELDARTKQRVVVFWALATGLAMWVSAALHLYFLRAVGLGGGQTPRWVEILATGLIIGAGTKPLHDLVKGIQAKADAAKADAKAKGV